MPRQEGIVDKNMFGGHTGIEDKHVVGEKTHKSPKASPPPSKIPKPPPPPPLPLSVKVTTASKCGVNKEYKSRIAVVKASSPELNKALPVEADKRLEPARKSKETLVSKGVTGYKSTWLEEKHEGDRRLDRRKSKDASCNDADKRSDPLRKSKETLVGHTEKRGDSPRKSRATSGLETDKRSDSVRKSKESFMKATIGPKTSPGTREIVAESQKASQKLHETSTKCGAAHKNAGPESMGKTTLCSECKVASKRTVCFIANDGKVAACSSGPSGHARCKYHWCAVNDPDYVPPSLSQPKKYLVSKRHLLKAQIVPKSKNNKAPSLLSDQKGNLDSQLSPSPLSDQKGDLDHQFARHGDEVSFSGSETLEDDRVYSDDGSQYTPKFSSGCELPEIKSDHRTSFEMDGHCMESGGEQMNEERSGRSNGVWRCYIDLTEEQESETLKLRRQLMQEREQVGEYIPKFGSGCESSEIKSNGQTSFEMYGHCMDSGGEQVNEKSSGCPDELCRTYIDLTHEQEAEIVKLRRQLMQEREQAGEYTPTFGSGSESPEIKSNDRTFFDLDGHCMESGGEQVNGKIPRRSNRERKSYIDLTQEQESETVKLRRQLMQERKQAGEWMIDSAIEEAIHKLAPSGETRVKVLVEAFESVISHNDEETHELHHWGASHEHNISHTHIAMHC